MIILGINAYHPDSSACILVDGKIKLAIEELEVKQWDAYELQQNVTPKSSLTSLLSWLEKNKIEKLICKTQIIIVPSYHLKIANDLITNFHQPNSTLLLLVAAIVGDDWKTIYNYAMNNDFRFLSYGDGSILFNLIAPNLTNN